MANAQMIIGRCGGVKAVAEWLGVERSTVQRWTYEHPRGRGNVIPVKNWATLIAVAKSHGVEITLEELALSAARRSVRNPKGKPKLRKIAA